MISNKLISFNKKLSNEFINHIHNTDNICLYKLGSHYIPENIIFPNVKTVTLINCNKNGILRILNPIVFPNIHKINYLSTDPGDFKIYKRFDDNIQWVFPNKTYDFYEYMVSAGRGKKNINLINEYITNKKIIDGKNGFDISFHFELNIPGFGITDGEWWRSQFYEYFVIKQNQSLKNQDDEELELQKTIVRDSIDDVYFEYIIDIDNKLK